MDNKRVLDKLDKIDDKLGAIDVTLAGQHVTLYEHMKRTALLERELVPIKKHILMLNAMARIVAIIIAGAAFAVTVQQLFS